MGLVVSYNGGIMIRNRRTLILNADFSPLTVVSWERGVSIMIDGTCFVLESARTYEGEPVIVHSPRREWSLPSVMMGRSYVGRGEKVRYSRFAVLARDNYTCQYCGEETEHPTIDHIRPKVDVAGHESNYWTNRCTACPVCNSQKGCRSLDVMRHERTHNGRLFRLIREPFEPTRASSNRFVRAVGRDNLEWLNYIPDWEKACKRLGKGWLVAAYDEWKLLHAGDQRDP